MDRLQFEFAAFLSKSPMQLPPQKVFVPKHGEIPLLLDYSGVAPEGWWQHWPRLTWGDGRLMKSPINPVKMVAWARRTNHPDMGTVLEIARDIRHGCDLGTRGEFLCPSTSSNAPSATEYGDRVTDSIVDGIKKGIIMGPMDKEEIPFESVKVNGMLVALTSSGDEDTGGDQRGTEEDYEDDRDDNWMEITTEQNTFEEWLTRELESMDFP